MSFPAAFWPAVYQKADNYPPTEWEYVQEQLGEDSQSDLWEDMTLDYYAMIGFAKQAFDVNLARDKQTTQTSDDFACIYPDKYGKGTGETWADAKLERQARTEHLENIAEEEEEEEPEELPVVEEPSLEKVEEPQPSSPLPEQPVFEAAAASSSTSTLGYDKPQGYCLLWAHIFPNWRPGYAASIDSDDTASIHIKWAPLPDATKQPRKPSKPSCSRRLRQSVRLLRGLVCCFPRSQ